MVSFIYPVNRGFIQGWWFSFRLEFILEKGSSIHDVTLLGGGSQGFCDDSTNLSNKKCDNGGRVCQKLSKVV